MKNNRLRILVSLLFICLLCTTTVWAKGKSSKVSKKKATQTSVKANKSTIKKKETQSIPEKKNNINDKNTITASSSFPVTKEEPEKEIIKIIDNTNINDLIPEKNENKTDDSKKNYNATKGEVSTNSSNEIPIYSQEEDKPKNIVSETPQEQIDNKQVVSNNLEKKQKNIAKKTNKPKDKSTDIKSNNEKKDRNIIEPFLLKFLNDKGISTDNIWSFQDILCVCILINLFLTFILFISIRRTRKVLSKSIDEINKKLNEVKENKELEEKLASVEKSIKNNIVKLEERIVQTDNNIQNKIETTQNAFKEVEQSCLELKSEFETKTVELNEQLNLKIDEKLNNQVNEEIDAKLQELANNNKEFVEKIQIIEEIQNNLKSNFDSLNVNEERIRNLENNLGKFNNSNNSNNIDNIDNNSSNNIFSEDFDTLKNKIKSFQSNVVNHLLKEQPECKWWIRFAEPNKLFTYVLSSKILSIIEDLKNKEELNSFNEFFSLFRNFCKTKTKCDELFNKVSKGEIGFSNSYTEDDLKKEIEQYNEELDQYITSVEIMPSIELDEKGKNLLSEGRDKIIDLVKQEYKELDPKIANLISIEKSEPVKETKPDNNDLDLTTQETIENIETVETIDFSLPTVSENEESIPDFSDLFSGEETSVVVNID